MVGHDPDSSPFVDYLCGIVVVSKSVPPGSVFCTRCEHHHCDWAFQPPGTNTCMTCRSGQGRIHQDSPELHVAYKLMRCGLLPTPRIYADRQWAKGCAYSRHTTKLKHVSVFQVKELHLSRKYGAMKKNVSQAHGALLSAARGETHMPDTDDIPIFESMHTPVTFTAHEVNELPSYMVESELSSRIFTVDGSLDLSAVLHRVLRRSLLARYTPEHLRHFSEVISGFVQVLDLHSLRQGLEVDIPALRGVANEHHSQPSSESATRRIPTGQDLPP